MRSEIKQFLDQVVRRYSSENLPIESVILFGSQARGDAKISSDVDLAIVTLPNLTHTERGKIICIPDEYNECIKTNLYFTTADNLASASLWNDTNYHIRNEGIVLWHK
ncbi:hypothetical protein FACS1894219_11120 [Clostridia bacterium]|nr:hypothetical protein FACS1894219_11120 [Clostridia bacterium]